MGRFIGWEKLLRFEIKDSQQILRRMEKYFPLIVWNNKLVQFDFIFSSLIESLFINIFYLFSSTRFTDYVLSKKI